MSDSKKTSSPYVVHENRSLDQWKVTELKEELKRRKLLTKGLKEDLVKRLDEAIRPEMEELNQNHQNGGGVYNVDQPEVPIPSENAIADPIVSDKTMNDNIAKNESLDQDNITDKLDKDESLDKDSENGDMPVQIDTLHIELVSEGEQASISSKGTEV